MTSTQNEAPHSPKTATVMATLKRINTQIMQNQLNMDRLQKANEDIST